MTVNAANRSPAHKLSVSAMDCGQLVWQCGTVDHCVVCGLTTVCVSAVLCGPLSVCGLKSECVDCCPSVWVCETVDHCVVCGLLSWCVGV